MSKSTSNLASMLVHAAQHFGDRPGLIQGDKVWTWAEINERVGRAAQGLLTLGVVKGDRVLVHSRNCNAMFETQWACWRIGAVWVPTNFRLTPVEAAYLASSSRAKIHIIDAAFPEHAASTSSSNPDCQAVVWIGDKDDGLTWEKMISNNGVDSPLADVNYDDVCWFFYTSGTTGRPKAAMLTHGQMAFVAVNHLCDLMPGTTEEDVSLVVAPLSHGSGIHAVTQVAKGAASVLLASERLDCDEVWELVEKHRVTNMFTVPTILTMITRHDAVDRVDHSSLRYIVYAGAPMYRADQQYALHKLGKVIVQYYGLGEVTGAITVLPPSMHSETDDAKLPIGSCGRPRTGMDIAILNDAGHRLDVNDTGEICVRGPAVFLGYFENDEANLKSLKHGWFHTGDLGHLDDRGYLHITGRSSDMYISGGSNVYPLEIEELLLTHPDVAEACVVGIPHEKWGECGVAVLVTRNGVKIEPDALLQRLEGKLSRYKFPSDFQFWESLPKSGYGKVAKSEVKKLIHERAEKQFA
ncbi:AMP-dependent synthetase/ligase [Neorhizobium galegae bv. officinalis]|nr:AMP-dependent synthetase/ligase [Neorhizobium galegae bv. officinalis]